MKDEDEDNIIPNEDKSNETQMIQTNLLMKDLKI
jgi:hypothetical protein